MIHLLVTENAGWLTSLFTGRYAFAQDQNSQHDDQTILGRRKDPLMTRPLVKLRREIFHQSGKLASNIQMSVLLSFTCLTNQKSMPSRPCQKRVLRKWSWNLGDLSWWRLILGQNMQYVESSIDTWIRRMQGYLFLHTKMKLICYSHTVSI